MLRLSFLGRTGLASLLLSACLSDHGARDAHDGGAAACGPPIDIEQSADLPNEGKVDMLFMIDNSGSMCEEQANLVASFGSLSRFLFDELGGWGDYRIAVINTDLRTEGSRGRFQDSPPTGVSSCDIARPNCEDLLVGAFDDRRWSFGSILKSGPAERGGNIGATREDLEHRFQCLATLGIAGDGFEKGLESMRLALSCEGPNKAALGPCCVDEMNADGRLVKSTYDPNCADRLPPGQAPEFLRPDATLVIVNLSDEVDCSDPASNPNASRRAICKFGPADGGDADAIPDGFQDPTLCPENDAAACYTRECGALAPDACYQARCVIDRGDNNNCVWYPEALTPVQDYVDFLKSLKADPAKIVVASIVGSRAFVDSNGEQVEVSHVEGLPAEACWYFDSNGFNRYVSQIDAACCPDGVCTGGQAPTCESAYGTAFTGRRYLELAEAFGVNGIGCPPGAPANGESCVTICQGDFQVALQAVRDKFTRTLYSFCLEGAPECLVPGGACATPDERAQPENYKAGVSATLECSRTIDQGGGCESVLPATDVPSDAFTVERNPVCGSGFSVTFAEPLPAGAHITLKFRQGAAADCLSGADL